MSFLYAQGRQDAVAEKLLEGVTGTVHTGGCAAYERLFEKPPAVVHASCWAHVRRKFVDALQAGAKNATEPLRLIAKLYEKNGRIRNLLELVTKRSDKRRRILSKRRSTVWSCGCDPSAWQRSSIPSQAAWNRVAKTSALPKGRLGTTIGYLEVPLPRFRRCLEKCQRGRKQQRHRACHPS